MDQIIAERAIYGIVNDAEVRVLVYIGAPHKEGDGHWSCSFGFDVGDHLVTLKSGTTGGVDGVQALLNALLGVSHVLDRSGIEWAMFQRRKRRPINFFPRRLFSACWSKCNVLRR